MPVRRPGGRRGRASHRACRPRRPRTGPGRRPGSARASRDKLVRHSCLGPRRRESACQWRLCGEFPDVGSGRDGASRPADRGTDAARRGHTGRLASAGAGLSASAQHEQLDPGPHLCQLRAGHGDLHRDAPRACHAGDEGRLPSAWPTPIRAGELPGHRRHGDLRPADPGNCRDSIGACRGLNCGMESILDARLTKQPGRLEPARPALFWSQPAPSSTSFARPMSLFRGAADRARVAALRCAGWPHSCRFRASRLPGSGSRPDRPAPVRSLVAVAGTVTGARRWAPQGPSGFGAIRDACHLPGPDAGVSS